jgi:hypothetical protein
MRQSSKEQNCAKIIRSTLEAVWANKKIHNIGLVVIN